jgi:hypothetical protein
MTRKKWSQLNKCHKSTFAIAVPGAAGLPILAAPGFVSSIDRKGHSMTSSNKPGAKEAQIRALREERAKQTKVKAKAVGKVQRFKLAKRGQ